MNKYKTVKTFRENYENYKYLIKTLTRIEYLNRHDLNIYRRAKTKYTNPDVYELVSSLNNLIETIINSDIDDTIQFKEFKDLIDSLTLSIRFQHLLGCFTGNKIVERNRNYNTLYKIYLKHKKQYNMLFNILNKNTLVKRDFTTDQEKTLKANERFRNKMLNYYNDVHKRTVLVSVINRETKDGVYPVIRKVIKSTKNYLTNLSDEYGFILNITDELYNEVVKLDKSFKIIISDEVKVDIIKKIIKFYGIKTFVDMFGYMYSNEYAMSSLTTKLGELNTGRHVENISKLLELLLFTNEVRKCYIVSIILESNGFERNRIREIKLDRYKN